MSTKTERPSNGVSRNPMLIRRETGKMALTYVGGSVCASLVTIIDTLIAGVSIGSEALAAISVAAPLLTIAQILHCLLGYGIDKLMIRSIGEGKREEANRIFAAILVAVVAVFAVVYAALLVFERPLLELILSDQSLVNSVIGYTRPIFVVSPVIETFLCIERAFRIDGRARLFSVRGIVTNIANIAFDVLLVTILGLGVSGLAWASVISTMIGYMVTLSHFFSKKRTVSPDFSVLSCKKELLSYIKRDILLGSTATLDEVMSSVALSVQTAAIGLIGGTGGLAMWSVYKSLRGVAQSVGEGVSASVSVHAGLLCGQEDYDGVRFCIREGLAIASVLSTVEAVAVLIFAQQIAFLYGVDSQYLVSCAVSLRIGCAAFVVISTITVFNAYLSSVGKVDLANRLVMLEYGLIVVAVAVGHSMGLWGFLACYVVAIWIVTLVYAVVTIRDRYWFVPEQSPESIASYSIQLTPDQIATLIKSIDGDLVAIGEPASFASRVALVVEDSTCLTLRYNSGADVRMDLEIKRHEDGVRLMGLDDGKPYNALAQIAQQSEDRLEMLEVSVVRALTCDMSYNRALDINQSSLVVRRPAKA